MRSSSAHTLVERLNRRVSSRRLKLRLIADMPFGEHLRLRRYRLGNGLTVLSMVDSSAPVLSFHTWFRVGSRHDRPGKTGLAHLFEHLMFNETENLPAGVFDRSIEEAGGESNAATWVDWTYYYVNLPSSELPLIVRLEADRMGSLVLREPQVVSEKEVVANERRLRVEDDVEGTMAERLYATAFKRHPYGQPTIGWMRDIQGFTTSDCEKFYRTHYAPNNAIVVVVGDVEEEEALGLIQERYGPFKPARIPRQEPVAERRQRRERRVALRRPTPSARLDMGYHAPAFDHPDHIALTLANELLFGGRSSRLYESLVREQELAVEARGALAPFQDPGLYEIWVALRQGRSWKKGLRVVEKELERLCREPVSEQELEKVKNRLDLGFLQSMETAGGKAEKIGFYETVLGDPSSIFKRLQAYRETSPKDIQAAARRCFDRRRRTLVTVEPN